MKRTTIVAFEEVPGEVVPEGNDRDHGSALRPAPARSFPRPPDA